MLMNAKKRKEAFYLEILRCEIADFPSGDLIKCNESPDFLFRTPHDILGIEVRRIFQETKKRELPLQSQESERRKIIQRAKQLCASLPPLAVSVHFSTYPSITKKDQLPLCKKIVEIVRSHVQQKDAQIRIPNSTDSTELPDQVALIDILGLPESCNHIWSVPEAGFIQKDYVPDIQSVLNEKEQLLPKYLCKCDRCWLLVVSEGYAPSSLFEPSSETTQYLYESSFERVFYIDGFSKKVVELKTETTA